MGFVDNVNEGMRINGMRTFAMKRKLSEIEDAAVRLSVVVDGDSITKIASGFQQPSFTELFQTLPTFRRFLAVLGWILCFVAILAQEGLLWAIFFKKVVGAQTPASQLSTLCIWIVWAAVLLLLRRSARIRSGELREIFDNAEVFVFVSMIMVFANNLAFYFHTPSQNVLFDLGFALIPEEPVDSKLRVLGEVLTIGFPVLCAFLTAFQTERGRIQSFSDFFRIISVAYGLRALTVPLTSLPGPAPHCRMNSHNYFPPTNWIDIVTELQGMYGASKTCGDLIFSGHTALTLTTVLVFGRKMDNYWGFSNLRWCFLAGYEGTIIYLILACRKHYSIDVILAVIVVILAFFHFEHSWYPSHIFVNRRPQYAADWEPVLEDVQNMVPLKQPASDEELTEDEDEFIC